MIETELAGVQGNSPLALIFELFAEGLSRAVLRVAEDRMAARGGLHADLVGPAGFERDFEPGAKGSGLFFDW